MKNKFIALIFIIITAYLNSDELINRYIADAKSFYVIKDYDKAYSRIKFVLKYYNYNENELTTEIKTLTENIYYEYIKKAYESGNYESVNTVLTTDPYYTTTEKNSDKIKKLKSQIESEKEKKEKEDELARVIEEEKRKYEELMKNKEEAEKLKKEKEEELEKKIREKEEVYKQELNAILAEQERLMNLKKEEDKLKDAKLQAQLNKQIEESRKKEENLQKLREEEKKELFEMQKNIIKERLDAEEKMQKEMSNYFNKFLQSKDKDTKTYFTSIIFIVSLLAGIFMIIFTLIIAIIVVFVKNTHRQQQRYYEYSMKLMESLPMQNQANVLSFPLPSKLNDAEQIQDENTTKKLSYISSTPDENMKKLKNIIETCASYGMEIDKITHRKNCSKNVSDLVYKISKAVGYSDYECLLHYAVSMVYDIGFLNIDPNILSKPEVSEEEFEIIKTHTAHGLNLIHFIDDDIKGDFIDGISKHHENLDGSGYPSGLKQKDIPYIARVIRVVESFISMISVRKYKKIIDKEKAIQLLETDSKEYDIKLINILNSII
ncbi:MAG: hypothetical protein JXB50_06415 [Spirochaetes bacterium]|nr:hypothetical protein [Spirochaetota bacterium]